MEEISLARILWTLTAATIFVGLVEGSGIWGVL